MAKSIKLKNNTYWDHSAIRYGVARKTFNIPANGTITLNFTYSYFVLIFSAKGALGGATSCWIIQTYGSGGTARGSVVKLNDFGTRELTYQIVDQTITISNPNNTTMYCSLLFLIGEPQNVTIS